MITLHNFSDKPKSIALELGKGAERLTSLLLGEHSQAGPDGKHKIVLEGYGYRWYRVGGWITSSTARSIDMKNEN
jgi:maltose alpha-D-glucosyltransferase/alpha-amylase